MNAIISENDDYLGVQVARTKSFDETKVLESAMYLFWRKGYLATSMKELEQVMGLNPTSIYNAFGSKRGLFKKVLDMYLHTLLSRLIESVEQAKTARQAINNVLQESLNLHFNASNPGGCLVVLSLLEKEQHDEATKVILDSALLYLQNAISDRLDQAQKDGEINAGVDNNVMANHVTALIVGMITMARAGFSRDDLETLIKNSIDIFTEQNWVS